MKSTLITRAAPLLITTMLVAAPAFAQQSNSASGTSPDTPRTPPVTASQSATPSASSAQTSSGPSGTMHKAVPTQSRNAAVARQPGETMQSLVERRIADLHSKLHITNDQGQQWNQFAQTMRDNAKVMDSAYQQRAEKLNTMSAVDNMQSFAQIEQQRSQDMQKLVPAFQTLYASLSDQQKSTADQLFRNYAASAQSHRQASAPK